MSTIKFQFIGPRLGVLLVVLTSLYAPFSRAFALKHSFVDDKRVFFQMKRVLLHIALAIYH